MTARDTHQLAECDLGGCDICLSYWELMHLMLRRVRRPAALEAALAQITELQTENARLRSYWAAHVDFGGDMHFVKPGQAVRPDGVVCDLVEATDENAAFDVSHVIDRITTDRAWILRPVVLPEGGTS